MRNSIVRVCAIGLLAVVATAPAAEEEGFVAMFNGKDLTGWEGQSGAWRVEDGAIVGQSTPQQPCKKTHYLYWKGGEPADFIMRATIRLTGGNSGIQFRSERRPEFDTFGYQADFDTTGQWTGCLFQHRRGAVVTRGKKAVVSRNGERQEETFATPEELLKKIKKGAWNDYEIAAQGSKVTLRLNGTLMCEIDDQDEKQACRKGIIALQMHQGPPMKVEFKELRIKVRK